MHLFCLPEYHGMSGKPLEKILEVMIMCMSNGNNGCWWIIILVLLFCCCGNGNVGGNNCGCGCDHNCC